MNCRYCNRTFIPIRSDQIYCTKKCGSDFRNKKNRDENKELNLKTKILKTNDRILMLMAGNNTIYPIQMGILKQMGFKPEVYTNIEVLKDKSILCRIVNYSFVQKSTNSDEVTQIIKIN